MYNRASVASPGGPLLPTSGGILPLPGTFTTPMTTTPLFTSSSSTSATTRQTFGAFHHQSSSSSTTSTTNILILTFGKRLCTCVSSLGRKQGAIVIIPALLLVIMALTVLISNRIIAASDISNRQNNYIIHYGYTGPESCSKHGFQPRRSSTASTFQDEKATTISQATTTTTTTTTTTAGTVATEPPPARIFDLIMFNREFEVLELRFHELSSIVEKFIIVESDTSHAGVPKPLYFHENRHKFTPFLSQVVHVVHKNNATEPYEIESLQRILGFKEGVRRARAEKGDLIIVADGDEIPRADVLNTLRHCTGYPRNVCLASRSYYLSFEFQHSTYWHYPNVITYDPADPVPLGDYRTDIGTCIADGGWHCSYCFADAERVLNKLASTMHVADGINSASRREVASDYDALYQRYCEGEDPLLGAWREYQVQQSLVGLPQYVVDNQDKYQWLLPGKCKKGAGQSALMEPHTGVRRWDPSSATAGEYFFKGGKKKNS